MSAILYTRDILRLAGSLVPDDRLEIADSVAEVRSPVCGSRIHAELCFSHDGTISALALRATACALGQASAAIVKVQAVGSDIATVRNVRRQVADMLTNKGAPSQIWPQFGLFEPAIAYPSRHAAILLPFDAILAAAEKKQMAS